MGRYANARWCAKRYREACATGDCRQCFKAEATRGVLCAGCWDKNTARNRAQPRKTARRWTRACESTTKILDT